MTLQITDHAEGCLLSVRAQPGAKRDAIVGLHAGMLKVAVTAPPDKGRANEAILAVLIESLDLKRSQIELWSGATSREKKFLVRGMKAEETRDRVAKFVEI